MATLALAPKEVPPVKREKITFCKRQKGAKLWNRFHSTVLMTSTDAKRLLEELRVANPGLEFSLEIERA